MRSVDFSINRSVDSGLISVPRTQPIRRQRLHEILTGGLTGRLTIVTAPAGFGKSTLVSAWTRTQDLPTAWLSIDEADSDSRRFMRHLIAAIQTCHHDIGTDIISALRGTETPPLETLFTALINDLTKVDDFLLILDDYHAVESIDIDRG